MRKVVNMWSPRAIPIFMEIIYKFDIINVDTFCYIIGQIL
jgi:hypothetical protein